MPLKNDEAVQVQSTVINANEWLIISISIDVHFKGLRKGEAIPVDADGNYEKTEKFSVTYLRLLDGVFIGHNRVELTDSQMVELITKNPTARDAIKKAGYDAISVIGEAPDTSVKI